MINVYIKFLTTKTELDYTQVQRAAIKILFWVAAVKRRWDAYCIVYIVVFVVCTYLHPTYIIVLSVRFI